MTSRNITSSIICIIVLYMCLLCMSCNNGKADNGKYNGDTVAVEVVKLSDTSSFVKSNGNRCHIIADASIAVPVKYKDEKSIETLRKLFAKYLLYSGDTLSIEDAMKQCVGNTLHQYDFSDAPDSDEIELDNATDSIQNYNNSVTVSVYYNKNDIVTFCKIEVVKKDGVVTSVTHRYYSFDLESMSFLGLNMLFREDAMTALTNELRNQLMANNKVTSNDQLNEIGYFNIDNLNVSRNFYFGENGITWSFMPNELAVEALGEPTVTLDYEVVEPFLTEKSVIKRLY